MFSPKVLCRSNKNSTSSSSGTSDISNCGHHVSQWITKTGPGPSPPKPLPRTSVPPVPRPRTLAPSGEPHSQQLSSQLPPSPHNKGTQHLVKDHNATSQLAQNFRWVTPKIAIYNCKTNSGLAIRCQVIVKWGKNGVYVVLCSARSCVRFKWWRKTVQGS